MGLFGKTVTKRRKSLRQLARAARWVAELAGRRAALEARQKKKKKKKKKKPAAAAASSDVAAAKSTPNESEG